MIPYIYWHVSIMATVTRVSRSEASIIKAMTFFVPLNLFGTCGSIQGVILFVEFESISFKTSRFNINLFIEVSMSKTLKSNVKLLTVDRPLYLKLPMSSCHLHHLRVILSYDRRLWLGYFFTTREKSGNSKKIQRKNILKKS